MAICEIYLFYYTLYIEGPVKIIGPNRPDDLGWIIWPIKTRVSIKYHSIFKSSFFKVSYRC